MKLHGMADAFRAQVETAVSSQLGFEERFAILVDSSGCGRKIALWRAGYNPPGSRSAESSKTLITSIRAASTANFCARSRPVNGCGRTRIFCSLGQPIQRHYAPPCHTIENTASALPSLRSAITRLGVVTPSRRLLKTTPAEEA